MADVLGAMSGSPTGGISAPVLGVLPARKPGVREDGRMLVVRATRKLLDRLGPPDLGEGEESTTLLGQWYATALFWKPQVALFVNETTLLPVLMPLAPAATLPTRFPDRVASVLAVHGASDVIVEEELRRMREHRLAKTADRSVVGVMNEFSRLAEVYRNGIPAPNLPDLSARLATVPCSPLYRRHISPDRELDALLRSLAPPTN